MARTAAAAAAATVVAGVFSAAIVAAAVLVVPIALTSRLPFGALALSYLRDLRDGCRKITMLLEYFLTRRGRRACLSLSLPSPSLAYRRA